MNNNPNLIRLIENKLVQCVPQCSGLIKDIPQMLCYSLEGNGKRIRPLLCLEFAICAGGDVNAALPLACAVEFIHTYSLIHDDLPCMDNDDYRRGKLSSHKKFGEANALLTGDVLLTHAFGIIAEAAKNGEISGNTAVLAVSELSKLAGVNGMIGGQYIDLFCEGRTASAEELFTQDLLKTSCLIEAACVLGLISAGASSQSIEQARIFARSLGIAFQIKDDILEILDDGESSDDKKCKATYVSIYGINEAKKMCAEYTDKAIEALEFFGDNADSIRLIAKGLLERKS